MLVPILLFSFHALNNINHNNFVECKYEDGGSVWESWRSVENISSENKRNSENIYIKQIFYCTSKKGKTILRLQNRKYWNSSGKKETISRINWFPKWKKTQLFF